MSSFALKLLALISMFIDHIGAVVIGQNPDLLKEYYYLYMACRMIGRLSFPIFCFALVEGYRHTKNLKRYVFRVGVFALISELPFDLALSGVLFDFSSQNIMFSFFICIVMLYFMDRYRNKRFIKCSILIIACALLYLLKSDYTYMAGLLTAVLYLMEDKMLKNIFSAVILSTQQVAPLALIPIEMYNGKRGKYSMKYVFYIFYPLHLLLLYFMKNFIMN